MRIITLDEESEEFCDLEPLLRPLVLRDDRLAAAKIRMLLELIRHLQASGPEPRAFGWLTFDKSLHLCSEDESSTARVTIRPDWYDYGPWEGDLPRMHYRVNICHDDRGLSTDIRTQDPDRVERAVRDAFGWE